MAANVIVRIAHERALGRLALRIDREANGAELHLGDGMVPIAGCGVAASPTT